MMNIFKAVDGNEVYNYHGIWGAAWFPPLSKILQYQYVNILLAHLTSLKWRGSLLSVRLLMRSVEFSSLRIF